MARRHFDKRVCTFGAFCRAIAAARVLGIDLPSHLCSLRSRCGLLLKRRWESMQLAHSKIRSVLLLHAFGHAYSPWSDMAGSFRCRTDQEISGANRSL